MESANEGERGGAGATTTSGRLRKATPWWQTLPGLITAFAALITAVTGLVAILHSGGSPQPEGTVATERPSSSPSPSPASTSTNGNVTKAITLPLPAPSEVSLSDGETTIRILSMRIEPYNAETRSLVVAVRYTNNSSYPANFWNRSFRLIVDGAPREPSRDLNEVVGSHAAKEGTVVFDVPAGLPAAALRIFSGNDQTDIPLDLAPRR